MTHYAFVDVETTGLDVTDSSIVEIGIVATNEHGVVIDEYETVINPLHKMAATKIHGIRASTIAAAPTFELVAAEIAERLDGAVLVAYNARFDSKFVGRAMADVGGTLSGDWTCAMTTATHQLPQLLRRRLVDVADSLGVAFDGDAHSAGGDARVCAEVFFALPGRPAGTPCAAAALLSRRVPALRRVDADDHGASRKPVASNRSLELSRPVDRALIAEIRSVFDDNVVTLAEAKSIVHQADTAGLTAGDLLAAYNSFLDEELGAVLADGYVDADERLKLRVISHHLGFPAPYIEARLGGAGRPELARWLVPGMATVFTGFQEDEAWYLTQLCAELGIAVRHGVAKTTDLVVHDGPPTTGKARKATELGIPLMPISDFRDALGVSASRAVSHQAATEVEQEPDTSRSSRVIDIGGVVDRFRRPRPAAPLEGIPAGWFVDPLGRNQWRWWDGSEWTATVANDGVQDHDPIVGP